MIISPPKDLYWWLWIIKVFSCTGIQTEVSSSFKPQAESCGCSDIPTEAPSAPKTSSRVEAPSAPETSSGLEASPTSKTSSAPEGSHGH